MPNRATAWFVNATENHSALPAVCRKAWEAGQLIHILYRLRHRDTILQAVPPGDEFLRPVELAEGSYDLPGLEEESEIFFLPCSERIDWAGLRQRPPLGYPHCLQPLFANPPRLSSLQYIGGPLGWWGWRARGGLARRILREPSDWPDPPRWQSMPIHTAGIENYATSSPPALTMSSTVLAVISFYRCEEWLNACLTCMTQQTRPPDNIVVVDDCSPALPLDLLEPFPNVTLLSTMRNVGPEKILNNIIRITDYDAYMVQDADDWSSHDRLELSLRGAEQTGADMVGTHEFRVDLLNKALSLCIYPPDVNHAMSHGVSHFLLHGTSLISRRLATRVGGFDERLKLGADTDFITRAAHAGRIVNLPGFYSFRRVRPSSLTTHEKTGYQSAARMIEDRFVLIRGRRNLELVRAGQAPNFFVRQTDPVGFIHHRGPKLRLMSCGLSG